MARLSLVSPVIMLALPRSSSAWGSSPGPSPPAVLYTECCTPAMEEYVKKYTSEPFTFAIGTREGPCCILDTPAGRTKGWLEWKQITADTKMPVWSASKWVTAFVILRLIDAGKFTLDTRAADILNFWTKDPHDKRSLVTVRHLLAQIDGMKMFPLLGQKVLVPGMCPSSAGTTISCAKHAYENLFVSSPGETWRYSDSSFYVLGAIAMMVTGHVEFNDVFQEFVARPLNIKAAEFQKQVLKVTGEEDPGANLVISLNDYSKMVRKVFAQTFVSDHLHKESERIHTLDVPKGFFVDGKELSMPMPQDAEYSAHYNLGSWRICLSNGTCADEEGVYIHCGGAQGFFPYIWRKGCESHWGIMAREGSLITGGMDSAASMKELLPLARAAMLKMPCTTTTTTMKQPAYLSGAYVRWPASALPASLIPLTRAF